MKKDQKKIKQKVMPGQELKALPEHAEASISEIAGEDVLSVVRYLQDKRNISEFKIAEDLDEEVNTIRSVLYRLHTHNMVTYYRKKDRQKGWYISYWTFNPAGMKHAALMLKRSKLDELKERLVREEENRDLFYMCPSLCTRMDFDSATDVSYRCPECGKTMMNQENSKTIALLRTKISVLESELAKPVRM
ncbi:hypothetical protein HY640_03735 [Candidatus Woesearchaeota archaeon]|nr:hypothetical protein [Candidatus Woesearchaeota archaeon]